jgi:hypothetical protein
MRPEPDEETEVSLHDLSPDDQLGFLVCAVVDLLCNGFGMTLNEARKLIASQMADLYPHVAFPSLPVATRLQ